jgi:hypothetical protein
MPYRKAHWFLLALFPIAALAFWPGYLSQLSTAPVEFHAHGVTATLWLMLLVAQSWSIQVGRRNLHRVIGLSSLVLFPLFLVGGIGIFLGMAQRFVEGSPFQAMYAARLAWVDAVGVAGFAYFYFEGLRQRRRVHVHARYLLATVIFLLPPILGRLAPILPPLSISGPQDFWKLEIAFHIGNFIAAAIAFVLAWRSGTHGRPFYIAGALTLLAGLLYQTVGTTVRWEEFYAGVADWPRTPLALTAILGGVLIGYAGWRAGRRPVQAHAQKSAVPSA